MEHDYLLHITGKFCTKKLKTRKIEKKVGHAYIVGNPFLTIKFTMAFKIFFTSNTPNKSKHYHFIKSMMNLEILLLYLHTIVQKIVAVNNFKVVKSNL